MSDAEQAEAEKERATLVTLYETMRARLVVDRMGLSAQRELVNLAQFAVLFNLDLRTLLSDLIRVRSGWRPKLYARLLSLTLIECVDDLKIIMGKPLREAIKELGASREEFDAQKQLHGWLVGFEREHSATLKAVRNNVIAHRAHDAAVQIDALKQLSVDEIALLSRDLLIWLDQLYAWLGHLLQRFGIEGPQTQ